MMQVPSLLRSHSSGSGTALRCCAAVLLLVVCGATVTHAAGPQPGQIRLRWEANAALQTADGWCVLDGSDLGITSLSVADLAPFVDSVCTTPSGTTQPIAVADFSRNKLSTLGPGLLTSFPSIQSLDLSKNAFTAASMDQLFTASTPGGCALCGTIGLGSLDLSYNNLGPTFPLAFGLIDTTSFPKMQQLYLISCGITDVPSEAMLESALALVDISLNNLRNGLHPFSFAGPTHLTAVSCAYCNLRTESLPVGVFDMEAGDLNLANNILVISGNYLPRSFLNDSRLFSKDRFTPPNATAYVHRLPTPQEYLDSWSNCFVDFPSLGALAATTLAPSGATYHQPAWQPLVIGDIVSFSGALLDGQTVVGGFSLTVDLAPQVAAIALGLSSSIDFCPLQSLAQTLNTPCSQVFSGYLTINAYDQPLPSSTSSCAFPDCVKAGSCPGTILPAFTEIGVPTEPAFLVSELGAWLDAAEVTKALTFAPPKFALWNPALNRSDWTPVDLLCDLRVAKMTLPGLPWTEDPAQASMPFSPPDGMLVCVVSLALAQIDWSAASIFSSGMLDGMVWAQRPKITLNFQLLYRGIIPVPPSFFDSLRGAEITFSPSANPSCMASDEYGSCKRMVSRCPHWSNGACEACPAGFTPASWFTYFYCTACSAGFMCDSTISTAPIPCPAGTFQPLTGQSTCSKCIVGTYSSYEQRVDPSSCIQCPPGTANPNEGGSSLESCVMCVHGTASGVPGVGSCPMCSPGTYQVSRGEFQCDLCGPNTYNPDYGSASPDSCRKCPDATPQSAAGSGSQLQCTADRAWCQPGYYTASSATQPCKTLCPSGSACKDGVILLCPPGSYTETLGSSSCNPCGAGLFGHFSGSGSRTNCLDCQLSSFSDDLIASVCQLCPAGMMGTISGATSDSSCVAVDKCLTATSIDSVAQSSDLKYCALGATVSIDLGRLIPGGAQTMHDFMLAAAAASNSTTGLMTGADVAATWPPLKLAPSLRLAAFTTDPVLSEFKATTAAFSNTSSAGVATPTKSQLNDAGAYSLFAVLLCVAFLPWLAYRFVPARVAVYDQFKQSHIVGIGESIVNSPTQLGAAFTWSFVWVSILVAILLGTESNTISTTELVPPSAAEYSGTARANWQITLRAYSGDTSTEMAKWCIGSRLLFEHGGPSGAGTQVTSRAQVAANGGQSCDIAIDCLGCGMSATAFVTVKLPFNAQLIEWELWLNSAQSGSWSRSYGVRVATPGTLLPIQSTISFTTIESYFVDARTGASASLSTSSSPSSRSLASRSGFEFNFIGIDTVAPQPIATFNAKSDVGLTFSFKKSDIILHTQLTNKQTALQIVAVVASTVVSLFALFGLAFKLLEAHVWKRCGWPTGPIIRDEKGIARLHAASNSTTQADLREPFLEGEKHASHEEDEQPRPQPRALSNSRVQSLAQSHPSEYELSVTSSRPGSLHPVSMVPRAARFSHFDRDDRFLPDINDEVAQETM